MGDRQDASSNLASAPPDIFEKPKKEKVSFTEGPGRGAPGGASGPGHDQSLNCVSVLEPQHSVLLEEEWTKERGRKGPERKARPAGFWCELRGRLWGSIGFGPSFTLRYCVGKLLSPGACPAPISN